MIREDLLMVVTLGMLVLAGIRDAPAWLLVFVGVMALVPYAVVRKLKP